MRYVSLGNRKIFMIGFGSIGPTALTLILRHIEIHPQQIEVIAENSVNSAIAKDLAVKFTHHKITPENYQEFFSTRLRTKDIIVNLSVGVSSLDMIALCHKYDALYLDTANEPWRYQTITSSPTTTYQRRQKFIKDKAQFTNGPTALMCHGANPGIVTHFAKRAILDVAKSIHGAVSTPTSQQEWANLAYDCDVMALHISELDTQRSETSRSGDEYVNTWSIDGFLEESLESVGFAWGTHEIEIPNNFVRTRIDHENCRIIELKQLGAQTQIKSWVPSKGIFSGYMIPHPESFSIAELFSKKYNETLYHPTVHFVYHPCQDAINSMHDAANEGCISDKSKRLLINDIAEGMDELGILILRKQTSQTYWYGSQLEINEARKLIPGNNATSIQVAAGVLSGLVWIIENPNCGLVEPEQVDFERALEVASQYLGTLKGHWSKWPEQKYPKATGLALNAQFAELTEKVVA